LRWTFLIGFVFLAGGCGYVDDNQRAAEIVAQAYLNAYATGDASAICNVLAPEVEVLVANGGTCETALEPVLQKRFPRLTVGRASHVAAPFGNPRYTVPIRQEPGRQIIVGRYGSIWRVIDGGRVP
jgi:hypothetical protein